MVVETVVHAVPAGQRSDPVGHCRMQFAPRMHTIVVPEPAGAGAHSVPPIGHKRVHDGCHPLYAATHEKPSAHSAVVLQRAYGSRHAPQSPGQFEHVSAVVHAPSPQYWAGGRVASGGVSRALCTSCAASGACATTSGVNGESGSGSTSGPGEASAAGALASTVAASPASGAEQPVPTHAL